MASQKNNQPPRQVLFVDDEPDFLQVAQETFAPLSEGSWEIHCASTTDAALEMLKRQKMDLVVVDVNMPLLDGIQFLNLLGKRYPRPEKSRRSRPLPPRKNARPASPPARNCSSKNRIRTKASSPSSPCSTT